MPDSDADADADSRGRRQARAKRGERWRGKTGDGRGGGEQRETSNGQQARGTGVKGGKGAKTSAVRRILWPDRERGKKGGGTHCCTGA